MEAGAEMGLSLPSTGRAARYGISGQTALAPGVGAHGREWPHGVVKGMASASAGHT